MQDQYLFIITMMVSIIGMDVCKSAMDKFLMGCFVMVSLWSRYIQLFP